MKTILSRARMLRGARERALAIGLVAALAILAGAGCVQATDYIWTNTVNNVNWNTAAGWSPVGTPGSGAYDTATVTNNAVYRQLNVNLNVLLSDFYVNMSVPVGLTLNTIAGLTLTATNSFVVSQNLNTTSTVTIAISNPSGIAALAVTNAAGNAQLVVGNSGLGTLTLSATAGRQLVVLADQVLIGKNASGFGTFNQTVAGSTLSVSNMVAGVSGIGSYTLSAVATNFVRGQLVIGQNGGAGGFVTQSAGLLSVTNAAGSGLLQVGQAGGGGLTLNGATAQLIVDRLIVATNAGSAGSFTWQAGTLTVKNNINGVALSAPTSDAQTIITNLLGTTWGAQSFQYFGLATNVTANFYGGLVLGDQTVNGVGSGLINQTAGTLAFTNSSGNAQLVLGKGGSGSYTLRAGATLIADQLLVATNSGAQGTFTWNAGGALTVGGVTGMGIVTNLIRTGQLGSNSVAILNLYTNLVGTADFYNGLVLGAASGGNGVINLGQATGTGSGKFLVTNAAGNAALVIGQNGAGSFALSNGTLIVDQLVVATNAGSSGTFTWNQGASVTVNSYGANKSDAMTIFTNMFTVGGAGPAQLGSNSLQALYFNLNSITGNANFTNGLVLGAAAGGYGIVSFGVAGQANAGKILMTNAAGNAALVIGQNGGGSFALNSGTLIVDQLTTTTSATAPMSFSWTAGAALTVNSYGANKNDAMTIFTNFFGPDTGSPVQWGSNTLRSLIFNTNVVGTANFYNGLVLGAAAGGTGIVSIGQTTAAGVGNLYVTNAAGTAALVVGQAGGGTFTLSGGSLTVNSLLVTNVAGNGSGSSLFTLSGGTLTTYGAKILMATNGFANNTADFRVGGTTSGAGTVTWNIAGGTNTVQTFLNASGAFFTEAGNNFNIGGTTRSGTVNVSGSNTVFELIGGAFNIGSEHDLGSVGNNQLNITGGAKVYNTNTTSSIYLGWGTLNNVLTVSDSNSLFSAYGIQVSKNASTSTGNNGNRLVVTNGATASLIFDLAMQENDANATGSKGIVSGTNSTLTARNLNMSPGSGNYAEFRVENGGAATFSGTAATGNSGGNGTGNWITVTGPGSSLRVSSWLGLQGYQNYLVLDNSATASVGGLYLYGSTSLYVTNNGVLTLTGANYIGQSAYGGALNRGLLLVDGNGSVVTNSGAGNPYLQLGIAAGANGQIVVQNGAKFYDTETNTVFGIEIGYASGATGSVTVAGANSLFQYRGTNALGGVIYVGEAGVGTLTVSNNATFQAMASNLVVGGSASAAGSAVTVTNGTLLLSNINNSALLDVRNGSLTIAGNGTATVDRLFVTNVNGSASFTSGALATHGTTISNGAVFVVGDGTSAASFEMRGGTHSFFNGLTITNNAIAFGYGTNTAAVSNYGELHATNGNLVATGIISGTGTNFAENSGTLTLLGNNLYTSPTWINGGTVVITNDSNLSSSGSAVVFNNGGTLQVLSNATLNAARSINLASAGGTIDSSNQTTTVAGVISGTGGLTKTGTGTLVLNATNNYNGGTTLSAGEVSVAAQTNLPTGDLTFNGGLLGVTGTVFTNLNAYNVNSGAFNGGFDIANVANVFTVTNNLAGSGSLTKAGAGTLMLGGNNAYSGGTALSNGTVSISADTNLGYSATLAFGGGTLETTNSFTLNNRPVTLNAGGGTLNVDQFATLTVTNLISGTTALTKAGAGTLVLGGNNSYSGGTAISNGTVYVSADTNLGYSATLAFGGGTLKTTNSFTLNNRPVALNAGGGTLNVDQLATLTVTNLISGTGALTKAGAGTLTMSVSNSYTGVTAINGGILSVGTNTALAGGGNVTFGGGTLQYSAANTVDYSSRIKNSTGAIAIDNNGQNVTFTSPLDSSNLGGLTKTGAGTLTLTTNSTYSGATVISGGTLKLQGAPPAPSGYQAYYSFDNVSGTNVINGGLGGATYNGNLYGGATVVSGGIRGNAMALTQSSGTVLDIANGGTGISLGANWTVSSWFNGPYYANSGGFSALFTGDSQWTVLFQDATGYPLGSHSQYTTYNMSNPAWTTGWHQLTTVGTNNTTAFYIDGTLVASLASEHLADSTKRIGNQTAGNQNQPFAAKLDDSYIYTNALTLNQVGQLYQAGLGGAGTNLLPTATPVQLASGATLDLFGVAQTIGSLADFSGAGGIVTNSSAGPSVLTVGTDNTSTTFSGAINDGGSIGGTIALTKTGAGVLSLAGANTFVGDTRVSAGTLTLSNALALANSTLNLTNVDSGVVTFAGNSTLGGLAGQRNLDMSGVTLSVGNNNANTTFSGRLSNGALTKTGTGTLVLTGTNIYTGGTTITGGTLQVGAAGTSGTLGSGNVTNNTTLVFNRTDTMTAANLIAGGGNLIQAGSGTVILASNNTYSGLTLINAGALQVGAGGASGALGTGNVTNNATLIFNRSDTITPANLITGSGNLIQAGGGTLILANTTNTYSGGTAFSNGTVYISADTNLGYRATLAFGGGALETTNSFTLNNRPVTLNAGGGTLNVDQLTTLTVTNLISGTGGLAKAGAGTLSVIGSNSYTGVTTLSGGILSLGTNTALAGGGNISFRGGTLQYSAANTVDYSGKIKNGTGPIAIDNNGQNIIFNSALDSSNVGGLTKTGTGTLTLTTNSAYTGATVIQGGTIKLQGASANPVSGSVLWLDAANTSSLLTSGSAVTNWFDQSSIHNNATQSTVGSAPTTGVDTLNGKNVLTLNGTGNFMYLSPSLLPTGTTASTMFTVAKSLSAGYRWVISYGTPNGANSRFIGVNNVGNVNIGSWGGDLNTSVSWNGATNEVTGVFNGGAITGYVNGNAAGSGAFNPTGATFGYIGRQGNSNEYWNGDIAEVLVYNSALSTANRQAVEAYLNYKWFGIDSSLLSKSSNLLPTSTALQIASGAMLDLFGASQTVGSLADYSGAGGTVTNSGGGAVMLTLGNDNTSTTFSGAISDGGSTSGTMALTKVGSGVQTLAGLTTYHGVTTVSGGTLLLTNAASVANSPTITVGTTAGSTAKLDVSGTTGGSLTFSAGQTLKGSGTVVGNLTIGNGSTLSPGNSPGTLYTIGNTTYDTGGTYIWEINNATGTKGVNPGWDWQSITGSLTIASTAIDPYNINITGLNLSDVAGTVANWDPHVDHSWVIASATGGISGFDTNKFTLNTTSFFNNNLHNVLGAAAFSIGTNGNDLVLNFLGAGTIYEWQPDASGTWSATNNWVGGIVPSSVGDIALFGHTLFTSSRNVTVDVAATVGGITFNTNTANGVTLVGTGLALTLNNGGSGAAINVETGSQTIATALILADKLTVSNATQLTVAGAISETGGAQSLTKIGVGTLTLASNNTYSGGTTINAGTLQVGAGGTTGTLGLGNVTNNSFLAFYRSGVFTNANAIFGTGALVQTGPGTLVVTNTINSTGPVLINAGTLQVGAAGTSGALGAGNVTNNSFLAFNRSDSFTNASAIFGTGALVQAGPGTLVVTNAINSTGPVLINAGTLQVGAAGTSGSLGTGTVTNNAFLVFNRTDTFTPANRIAGTGVLEQNGSGTLILANTNTYTGATLINAGQLVLGTGLAITNSTVTANIDGGLVFSNASGFLIGGLAGTGNVTLQSNVTGAAIVLSNGNNNANTTYQGILSGIGSLVKVGTGTLTLTTNNTYTGSTTVSAGTLATPNGLNVDGSVGSGLVNVNGGALAVTDTAGTDLLNIGAAGTGLVTVNGGALVVNNLLLTNVAANGAGTSFLTLNTGTLTTYGATILMATNGFANNAADFRLGGTTAGAGTFTWNIAGGTNTVRTFANASGGFDGQYGNNFNIGGIGGGKSGIVNVSGSNTVFEVSGGGLDIGAENALGTAGNNQLNISGGAKVYNTNTTVGMLLGWGSAPNVITVTDSNSLLSAISITVSKNSATGNKLIVTNGATASFINGVGMQENDNQTIGAKVIVTGTNSLLLSTAGGVAVSGGSGKNAEFRIENGGAAILAGNSYTSGAAGVGTNNWITVTGPGSSLRGTGYLSLQGYQNYMVLDNGATASFGGIYLQGSTSLYVTNRGVLTLTSGANIGNTTYGNAANRALLLVDGSGSVVSNTAAGDPYLRIGQIAGANGQILVQNGAKYYDTETNSVRGVEIGQTAGATGSVTVADANSLFQYRGTNALGGTIYVGEAGVGYLTVSNSATFQAMASSLIVGSSTTAAGSALTIDHATLLLSNITGSAVLDVRNGSLVMTNGAQLTADRLFVTNGINGVVNFSGGTLTARAITVGNNSVLQIGDGTSAASLNVLGGTGNFLVNKAGGQLLANAAHLTISGIFTNAGTLSFHDSVGTFNSQVVNSGTWVSDPTQLTFSQTLSNAPGATFVLSAGDVYSFHSNFVNQISNAASFDTVGASFIFNGGASTVGTQLMQVAGLSLGAYGASGSGADTNPVFFTHTDSQLYSTNSFFYEHEDLAIPGFTNNFALGSLQVANASTLMLADNVFGGPTAGLYVVNLSLGPGSQLIISNNVQFYFDSTNGVTGLAFGQWADNPGANVLLLPGSGFHSLMIPEPFTVMLLGCGGLVLWLRRRR